MLQYDSAASSVFVSWASASEYSGSRVAPRMRLPMLGVCPSDAVLPMLSSGPRFLSIVMVPFLDISPPFRMKDGGGADIDRRRTSSSFLLRR